MVVAVLMSAVGLGACGSGRGSGDGSESLDAGVLSCGNRRVDAREQCDDADLNGPTCASVGAFADGSLGCTDACIFDMETCESERPACGNGHVGGGEQCDGADLNGAACASVGAFAGGSLGCTDACTFDTSACEPVLAACGNGQVDGAEECDGADLNGATCDAAFDFAAGTLRCASDCSFDTSQCIALPPLDLATAGFLDVTTVGADPSGQSLSTSAIQAAIDQASTEGRVVFFPAGTYLVDDTLRCMQPAEGDRSHDAYSGGCILRGSSAGARPVIKLIDGASGFDDDSVPDATLAGGAVSVRATVKPVLLFWRQQALSQGGSTDPELENGARNYNQVIRNIDIDLGSGNPGAVGIRHVGAEGSAIHEVRIAARDGFAGLWSFPSSGGTVVNVEVVGGRHGIYVAKIRGGAHLLAGIRLSGQRDLPLQYSYQYPLTLVGFEIQHAGTPVFNTRGRGHGSSGHLALIDGTIEVSDATGAVTTNTDRSLYMSGVFFKGASTLVDNSGDSSSLRSVDPTRWSEVTEYAYVAGDGVDAMVDGVETSATIAVQKTLSGAPPADLIARHVYPDGLCSFEDPKAVDARDFGVVGDGAADDTAALQAALLAADKVLLPKGRYLVTDTLELRATTQLCGISTPLTVIQAGPTWAPSSPTPMLRAPDDADAAVVLDSLELETVKTDNHVYHLHWRAGRRSIVKNVTPSVDPPWPGSFDTALQRVRITGNGGGRWYGMLSGTAWDCMDPGCRLVLIDGTRQRLAFYGFHTQYLKVAGGPLAELTDARNVDFYAHKSETIIPGQEDSHTNNFGTAWPILMRIDGGSRAIRLFGSEGPTQAEPGRGLFEIGDATDVTLVNVGRRNASSLYPASAWYFVEETGTNQGVDASRFLGLYRRSAP